MPDPRLGSTQKQSGTLKSGGLLLSYATQRPNQPKALIIIVHGINDHKARYAQLQTDLAAAGFASLAYDQRGFGQSEGKRCDVMHYELYHEDLSRMFHHGRSLFSDMPLFLFGHSLGAAIAATFCINLSKIKSSKPLKLAGLILSSPAYKVPSLPLHLEFCAYILNVFLPGIHIPYPSQHKKRSHDPEVILAVEKDPLIVAKGTPRFYIQFRKMNRLFQQCAGQIESNTLILQAGDDQIIDPSGARLLFNQLKNPNKKMINYEHYYHEVFHEIGRARVVQDMLNWMNEQLSDEV